MQKQEIHKSFRYRIYPSKEQELFLARQFGSTRFVYNFFLNKRKTEYLVNGISLNYHDNARDLTQLKTQDGYEWLYDINSQTLQASLRNLEIAYTNFFFKHSKFPKFKKRSNDQCIKIPQNFSIEEDGKLYIPKLKTGIKVNQHTPLGGKAICCFISKSASGKYHVSILCEKVNQKHLPKNKNVIGIDLGIKNFLTTSNNEVVKSPKFGKSKAKKLKFKQRQLSKKKKGSKNRNKARIIVALQYEKIANQRSNFLHQLSMKIINENQIIICEDLKVIKMMKDKNYSKEISDCSWGEFLRQLEYKAEWYGRTIYFIDSFFPSSKMCNHCKFVVDELPTSVRRWTCPSCESENDRDYNAALNILEKGLTDLDLSKSSNRVMECNPNKKLVEASSKRKKSSKEDLLPEESTKQEASRL